MNLSSTAFCLLLVSLVRAVGTFAVEVCNFMGHYEDLRKAGLGGDEVACMVMMMDRNGAENNSEDLEDYRATLAFCACTASEAAKPEGFVKCRPIGLSAEHRLRVPETISKEFIRLESQLRTTEFGDASDQRGPWYVLTDKQVGTLRRMMKSHVAVD